MKRSLFLLSLFVPLCLMTPGARGQNTAKSLFQSHCAMCHGSDGRGNTPAGKALKAPDFHDPAAMKMTDAELTTIIGKGEGKMPAYENKLSTNEIRSLVAYIRVLESK